MNNIDSKIQGCKSALYDLKQLQERPKEFYNDNRVTFRTVNENANTAYTKEAYNSLRYLGNRKNTINYSSVSETAFQFYEKRQEIIKIGKIAFLEEKRRTYGYFNEANKEKIQTKS